MHAIYYAHCACYYKLYFFHLMNLEGVDYVLSQSNFVLANVPFSITVTLLNDGVAGEEPETITLTLRPDRDLEPIQQLQSL